MADERQNSDDATKFRSHGAVAVGTEIGSYRIERMLAQGGMGVVYAATDVTLNRPVAIKFLSDELFDAAARRRFQREAQMASALNHPHILTVHAAGEHDGRQYLVTEFVDGGTLHDWIERQQPHSWRQCVELLIGVADALAAAHGASILHRDVKPANILVSRNGYAKLADFGLAKLAGETAPASGHLPATQTGTVIGTIAYMSPEQAAGRELDARSDVFSFGIVLYELLAGRRPFEGATDLETLQLVRHADAPALPDTIPEHLRMIVAKALEKDPAERYQTMRDFVVDLRHIARRSGEHHSIPPAGATSLPPPVSSVAPARTRRGYWIGAAAAGVALAALAAAWSWQQSSAVDRARRETIPEIARLAEQGDYTAAFARAQEVEQFVRDDPLLSSVKPLFTATFSVTTSPPDAAVYVRGYDASGDEWQSLGRTPLTAVALPRRVLRWRIEKDGFERTEIATTAQDDNLGRGALNVQLQAVEATPLEMVYVPEGAVTGNIDRTPLASLRLAPFFIDRYEVTNREYKEFVDAGGYERPSYWDGIEIADNGQPLTFEDAMRRFVDTTGRPGPATWEVGTYPDGRADYPVTGISWYEAVAYARYRGKSLPTVYHWIRAALPDTELASSLSASVTPLSNFGSSGPAPVGSYAGLGPYGTYDMFGNVREWCWNDGPSAGWVIGGSWQDPEYQYNVAAPAGRLERSPYNGLRLIRETETSASVSALREPLDLRPSRDPTTLQPVTDDVYAAYRQEFAYQSGDLAATEPVTIEETEDWTKQRVTINTGYDGERMSVILFMPKRFNPPYQATVIFSGIQDFLFNQASADIEPGFAAMPLDYLVKSGRVFVHPVYQGSYERLKAPYDPGDGVRNTRETIQRRWDLGRTLDYLATRPDIDATRVAYIGVSFGASIGLPLVATESRLKAAVFLSGGLASPRPGALIEGVNHAPRITIPVLMVNGRFDELFPYQTSQIPLFQLLGTPPEQKRHVVFESGHGSPPRAEVLRETLGWLDTYLGPVR